MKQDFENGTLSRLAPPPAPWLGWVLIGAAVVFVGLVAAAIYWWPL